MAAAWSGIKPSLSNSVLNIVEKLGFQSMTPVQVDKEIIWLLARQILFQFDFSRYFQTAAIPLFMSNKDVAVEAVSSSIDCYAL